MPSLDAQNLQALLLGLLTVPLAVGIAVAVVRFGPGMPGFAIPWRRFVAATVLAGLFLVALLLPVLAGALGLAEPEAATVPLRWDELFTVHILILITLAIWLACALAGVSPEVQRPWRRAAWEVGVLTPRLGRELGIGLVAGPVAMAGALAATMAVAMGIMALQGPDALPQEIAPTVLRIAALPVAVRLLVSLSAGVVEEIFFRGFLQRRIGMLPAAALFVFAHASYQAPLALVGITALALIFAFLTRWRGTIWPAAVAHTIFDAVQLLVLVPVAASQAG